MSVHSPSIPCPVLLLCRIECILVSSFSDRSCPFSLVDPVSAVPSPTGTQTCREGRAKTRVGATKDYDGKRCTVQRNAPANATIYRTGCRAVAAMELWQIFTVMIIVTPPQVTLMALPSGFGVSRQRLLAIFVLRLWPGPTFSSGRILSSDKKETTFSF